MKTATFDCVQMKRKGSAYVYQQIKDMTIEEEIKFWQQKNQELAQLQLKLRTDSIQS